MYPPVEPDELARHVTEVGRILQEVGLTPASGPRWWPPLTLFDFTRVSLHTKAYCYQHFRQLGLLTLDVGYEEVLFYHLLHTAWLLAFGYIYQDHEGLYWVDPRQPYDYCLNYELAEATLAELIGLGQLETLAQLISRNT